jgi:hypothetical protein
MVMKLCNNKTVKNTFLILINIDISFTIIELFYNAKKKISRKGTGYDANIHVGYVTI